MTLLIISSPVVVGGEIIAVGCTAAEASAIGSTAASVGGSGLLANTAGAVGISMDPVLIGIGVIALATKENLSDPIVQKQLEEQKELKIHDDSFYSDAAIELSTGVDSTIIADISDAYHV